MRNISRKGAKDKIQRDAKIFASLRTLATLRETRMNKELNVQVSDTTGVE